MPPKRKRGETEGGGSGRGRGATPAVALTPAQVAIQKADNDYAATAPTLNRAAVRPLSVREHDITDIYYLNDQGFRRAIPDHESNLTSNAAADCKKHRYWDQAAIADGKNKSFGDPITKVRIVVNEQEFWTLYSTKRPPGLTDRENEQKKTLDNPVTFPPKPYIGFDKSMLMKCSSLAEEFFTLHPDKDELHLPVQYPRKHDHDMGESEYNGYTMRWDYNMAYMDPSPIKDIIGPWLWLMEANPPNGENGKYAKFADIPQPVIPGTLDGMIHAYNAMLQLGVPKFFQKPLIEALCKQMHQTKLLQCHLDLLEITIGRFHGGTVPIVDPVLNHFVGTFAFRAFKGDRDQVSRSGEQVDYHHLEYGYKNAERSVPYDQDTVIIPPELPVLGHSIKNWSGVRCRDANGDASVAHEGYPLNVGKVLKHWRRFSTEGIRGKRPVCTKSHENDVWDHPGDYGERNVDYTEYSTYVLKDYKEYYTHIPGVPWMENGIAKPEGTLLVGNERNRDPGKPVVPPPEQ
jgi:hypothetical protein